MSQSHGKRKATQDSSQQRKRVVLTHAQKHQLCLDYQKTPRPTQEELAAIYKCKQNTVSDILKKKDKWLFIDPDSEEANKQRERAPYFPQVEEALAIWTTNALAAELVINGDILREKAKTFARGFEIDNFVASNGEFSLLLLAMTNKRNNKAFGTSAPKRPAQSPPSGNIQGQGSSTSITVSTSQPSTDSSNKYSRVSSEPVMDQDNILSLPAPQNITSTSSPPPVNTNTPLSAPDSDTSLEDFQHSPSNSADKGKSVEITPSVPERVASSNASAAAIQSSPLRFYAAAAPIFASTTSMDQFETTWAVLCTGHCLRVCLAFHSTEQRAIRRAHVALLAGLLRGSVAADLSEIAKKISAKSVNVPFFYNSYNPKPYAYELPAPLRILDLLGMNQMKSYADAAGQRAPSRSHSHPRSSRSRSQHNNRRHPRRPSQADLDYDVAGMDMPPLMDWQQITNHITTILEEITYLTAEFSQLQSRVKWLEDQHSFQPCSVSSQLSPPRPPMTDSIDQGWNTKDTSDSRRLSDNLIDFSSPISPQNGPSLLTQSHIPLPPRMSLIPGPATSPEQRLSSLTATVTELTKTVKQDMAQQQQFLAARDNANNH
ncbi:hypothetical protein RhiirA4_419222 [Rhizophagus irregularis]|uniref:Uncharacterized protein n=1 Tax=Rhizophagus irregularis TaxID=588596 RepID=A0A2I1GDE8_9GLOM|nr:hypothetical protein RhiirA4_419222 [Rhizophagus irregularis]